MKLSGIFRTSATVLTVFLAAAILVTITLTSPARPVRAGGASYRVAARVMPPQPAVPRTQLVPVPASAPAGPPAAGERVALRLLIIATDDHDFQLPAWRMILDRIGTPYDVLLARSQALTAGSLVRPDGVGRYSAILLTSSALLYQSSGGYVSAFSPCRVADALGLRARLPRSAGCPERRPGDRSRGLLPPA